MAKISAYGQGSLSQWRKGGRRYVLAGYVLRNEARRFLVARADGGFTVLLTFKRGTSHDKAAAWCERAGLERLK